jgi:hypothetical protein
LQQASHMLHLLLLLLLLLPVGWAAAPLPG